MVKGIVTFAHTALNVDKISGFKDTVLKKTGNKTTAKNEG